LKQGGRQVGVAGLISKAFTTKVNVLVNEEIASVYGLNRDFAVFLTEYIKGKPKWLAPSD